MDKLIDWHPADIIAGLRKKGTSMAAESRKNGLSSSTLANVLSRPWPKGEMIIAKVLETDPWVIWPSRYHDPVTHEFIDRSPHLDVDRVEDEPLSWHFFVRCAFQLPAKGTVAGGLR